MSTECATIHRIFHGLQPHRYGYEDEDMPCNGIYLLFENGERGHGHNRIVRIGNNNKEPHRLPLRLKQHFHFEHKNSSIFRKSIW